MGTRAVINFQGKPLFATHWDGDPQSLGSELAAKKARTPSEIFSIAVKHQIDASSPEFRKKINDINAELVSKRDKIPLAKVKSAFARGNTISRGVQTPENSPAGSMEAYDDWAEYEYDVNPDGTIKVRERSGSWRENKTGNWKRLEEVL